MAHQRVISSHFPYLPAQVRVRQRDLYGAEWEGEALLDTGFTGELVIPETLIANGARPSARMTVRLGDESEVPVPVYLACLNIGPFGPISVTALALGDEVVLGVGVMDRFTITLDHAARIIVEQ